MATSAATPTICVVCDTERRTYLCDGCAQRFCGPHLDEHRKNLEKDFHQIEYNHDEIRQIFNDQKQDPGKHPLMKEIDQWERNATEKIRRTANQCRNKFINYRNTFFPHFENQLDQLAEQMKQMRGENEFNDLDLNQLKQKLNQLEKELLQPSDLSLEQHSTSFINFISLRITWNTQWKQFGMTAAGGNGHGNKLDQFSRPQGFCVDSHDQTIYIADWGNARIMKWTSNARNGRMVAGGDESGDQNYQLDLPTDVIFDRENDSLIIADSGNRRVIRWSHQTSPHEQIIISDIACHGLAMYKDGSLYVSDSEKNEVRRWKKGKAKEILVAGGRGRGNQFNQLNAPTFLFVDDDHTLYVSDTSNHRVMKWVRNAKEGIVVAGGNGEGNDATQLSSPAGVAVDQFGQIYVVDRQNNRVMRWCEGAKEGIIVVGGNGTGEQANQLHWPMGLSFDRAGNLYVVDCRNDRIQKFEIDGTVNQLMK